MLKQGGGEGQRSPCFLKEDLTQHRYRSLPPVQPSPACPTITFYNAAASH